MSVNTDNPAPRPCPTCGHCPTCGQRATPETFSPAPLPINPYIPPAPPYPLPPIWLDYGHGGMCACSRCLGYMYTTTLDLAMPGFPLGLENTLFR